MNESNIRKQYQYIKELIEKRELNKMVESLDELLFECSDWWGKSKLNEMKTSYAYMLQYMRQGMADPDRLTLYNRLLKDAYSVADQTFLQLMDKYSSEYFHSLRRDYRANERKRISIEEVAQEFNAFSEKLPIAQEESHERVAALLHDHEDFLKRMFLSLWVAPVWGEEDKEFAWQLLSNKSVQEHDLATFVSTITLSLMKCFDITKILWLLDAYLSSNILISRRALVGVMLVLFLYGKRLELYPEIAYRLEAINEKNSEFVDDLFMVYKQLLLAQETESIDRKMREEIIPEVVKKIPFDKINLDNDDLEDDNSFYKNIKGADLEDKMSEIAELKMEGGDVYMSTFSFLKSYPFFRDIHHWFYTFNEIYPEIYTQKNDPNSAVGHIVNKVLTTRSFCDSDKFSLFYTLSKMPEASIGEMLEAFNVEQEMIDDDLSDKSLYTKQPLKDVISGFYINDLYRFFKLNMFRDNFQNLFSEHLYFYKVPYLKEYLLSHSKMATIIDFCVKKKRWEEVIELFSTILPNLSSEEIAAGDYYTKLAYALQKTKSYYKAIEYYHRSDMITPNSVWINRKLADCYRDLYEYDKALEYYKKLNELKPDDPKITFCMAICLAELKDFKEAINAFFKLDFIEKHSIKAWRGVAWCSFMLDNYEQSIKYYLKVLDTDKVCPVDYLNIGHTSLVMGNLKEAISYYQKAYDKFNDKEDFYKTLNRDKTILLEKGISREDVSLIQDMFVETK